MNEIEDIKAKIDIVDLAGQYVTLKKAGANYKAACPFHGEKTASLMVSPQKQIWKCFGCGKGGTVFDFVMEAEHLDFGDALRLLAQKAGVTLHSRTETEYQSHDKKSRLYRINMLAAKVFQKLLLETPTGKPALDYIKKRGLSEKTIKDFCLGFAPSGFNLRNVMAKHGITPAELSAVGSPEKFFNRIIFPIYDVLGNVIAFTGRAMGDVQPKYLNSPETALFNKSRVLYGLNTAKAGIKKYDYVVLVEGQMDVLALHQGGVTQTVASSGTAITDGQISILSKYTNNFLLAFDADPAGQMATKKVIEMLLRQDLNSKVVEFSKVKDAGELFEKSADAWPQMVKDSKEGVEWLMNKEIEKAGDVNFIENKKKVLKEILPILGIITDQTRLDHYVGRLALFTKSKPESIYQSLGKTTSSKSQANNVQSTSKAESKPVLTNEEQLLAFVLGRPTILTKLINSFDQVVWQSLEAESIAVTIKNCYNKPTKTNVINQIEFFSSVKNQVAAPLAQKIDSWQFWLSSTWPEFPDNVALELATEKLSTLSTKKYEQQKSDLASQIRLAQEQGDLDVVKKLMGSLNNLTKQNT